MLKKDITYKDLDGNDVTETFWFHMNKAELAEMAMGKEGKEGGFEQWVKNLIAANDGEVIVANFKKILLATIGRRSDDNKRFIKSDEIRQEFEQSDAYSELFMELISDSNKMTAFVNGVVPQNLREEVEKVEANQKRQGLAPTTMPQTPPTPVSEQIQRTDDEPAWIKEGRVPTADELKGATPEQLQEAFRRRESSGS